MNIDAQDHADDLYCLQKSIDKLLDSIGQDNEEVALADVTQQIEGLAISLGITQKIRSEFLNFLKEEGLELMPKPKL